MRISVKVLSISAIREATNSRHACSHYVISTHLCWVGRNLAVKVGAEYTISTMATWLSAQTCCTIILVNMMLSPGKISNISSDKLCTVATLLMTGTEGPTLPISRFSLSPSFYSPTSTCSIICSSPQIPTNSTMKVTRNTFKKNYLLKSHKCLVCIPMLKSVT